MKRSILTAIILAALSVTVVRADNLQPIPSAPTPGSPGTATPTPYPQATPPSIPRAGGTEGNAPLLPKIDIPGPPKDQPLPGLEPSGKGSGPGPQNDAQQNDRQKDGTPNDL